MDNDVLSAAEELRQAIREIAHKTTELDLTPEQLRKTAEHLRIASNNLQGLKLPPWWEREQDDGSQTSRTYQHRSLFQGQLHPFSPTLHWGDCTGPDGESGYQFETTLSSLYEGPPHAVHGGYIAGLYDELLGAVQSLSQGDTGYTAKLLIRYRSFTPTEKKLVFRGWITKSSGRRINVKASCHDGDRLCSEAEALFLRPRTDSG
tara:strand:- start:816 stop:1430 length:615 start_codon:yes stop_codon:yes gene_type:complete